MIDFYESKHKRVILDNCDIKTPLGNIYKCETSQNSERKIFTNEIILDRRNKLNAETLVNSSDKKIIITSGKMHLKGIKEYLKK